MRFVEMEIKGIFVAELVRHGDERGFFMETFRASNAEKAGLNFNFVQDNRSFSRGGLVRGFHYQINRPQGHMVSVMRGRIFDVGVDLRPKSKTFGKWFGIELSALTPQQVFFSPGIAHGFCTLDDENEIYYKCTDYYFPDEEGGLLWNDVDLNIPWPISNPAISERDSKYPRLRDIPESNLPKIQMN